MACLDAKCQRGRGKLACLKGGKMYLKEIDIGNVKCKNNIFLAPMAGITDLPFRLICEKYEPGLVVTEMVSSKALLYNDEKTKKLLNVDGEKRPISMQICRYSRYKYGLSSTKSY